MPISKKTIEKRKKLSTLSRSLKPLVAALAYDSINEALVEMYKQETGAKEFKTFWGWIQSGFAVKKGSKSFDVWGKPLKRPVDDSGEENKEFQFFPLCCLFGDHQVEKAQSKKESKQKIYKFPVTA